MAKLKYSPEGVVAEFLKVKDAPNEELTLAYAQKHYDWFRSACTQITGNKRNTSDWYGALEGLYTEHGGMTPEQAKQKVKEIRQERKLATIARNRSRTPEQKIRAAGKLRETKLKYTREQIVAKFLEIKNAPNEQLTNAYAQKHYDWNSSACTRYGKRYHDWYGTLEKLYAEHGGMTPQQAKQKIKEIKQEGKESTRQAAMAKRESRTPEQRTEIAEKLRKAGLKYTREQVVAKFLEIKNAPNEQLTRAYAQEHYDWNSSACTHYGKRHHDWYGTLEKLFAEHGGMTPEQAKQKIEEIKQAGKRNVAAAVSKSKLKYTREQVIAKFLEIKNAPNEQLTLAYAKKHYDWFRSTCTQYGATGSDWYGALERLYTEHAGMMPEQAKQKIREIRQERKLAIIARNRSQTQEQKTRAAKRVRERNLKYTREQVIAKFLEIKNAPNEQLTLAYAKKHYDWFRSACTQIAKNQDYTSDWYGALEKLFAEHGGMTPQQAKQKIEEIRKKGKEVYMKNLQGKAANSNSEVVVVPKATLADGEETDYSVARQAFAQLGAQAVETKPANGGKPRIVLEIEKRTTKPTEAQKARNAIGKADAGGDWAQIAEQYARALPKMAPFVRDRALAAFLCKLATEGTIQMPATILSQASGPGQLFDAVQDLKPAFERVGATPKITDLDASEDMLILSKNPEVIHAPMEKMPVPDASFDAVENSSLYQFKPVQIKQALLEANRATKTGGLLILSTMGKRFSKEFREALKALGFEVITRQDETLTLSQQMKEALETQFGKEFTDKATQATQQCHVLIARKICEPEPNVTAANFAFKKTAEQQEAERIGKTYRNMNRRIDKSDRGYKKKIPEDTAKYMLFRRQQERASQRAERAIGTFFATATRTGFALKHPQAWERISGHLDTRMRQIDTRANRQLAKAA